MTAMGRLTSCPIQYTNDIVLDIVENICLDQGVLMEMGRGRIW